MAAERQERSSVAFCQVSFEELKPVGYYTAELMRCTFSESCCPQEIDMIFKSKEAYTSRWGFKWRLLGPPMCGRHLSVQDGGETEPGAGLRCFQRC